MKSKERVVIPYTSFNILAYCKKYIIESISRYENLSNLQYLAHLFTHNIFIFSYVLDEHS